MVHEQLYNARFSSIIELTEIDSTNNYASRLIAEGMAVHGNAIFAHKQMAGRGQRGKTWFSDKNESILMSTMVQPKNFLAQKQFLLIAVTALAIRKIFDQYAQSDTQIKWPNDIYCLDRKAGGILIENSFSGTQWNWAVIGTGININQKKFEPEISRGISLKQITGKDWDMLALADEFRAAIVHSVDDFWVQNEKQVMDEYNHWLFKKNELVHFIKEGNRFSATVKEVTSTGELIISGNTEEKIQFGEVIWDL